MIIYRLCRQKAGNIKKIRRPATMLSDAPRLGSIRPTAKRGGDARRDSEYNDFASTGVTVVTEADMAVISDLSAGSRIRSGPPCIARDRTCRGRTVRQLRRPYAFGAIEKSTSEASNGLLLVTRAAIAIVVMIAVLKTFLQRHDRPGPCSDFGTCGSRNPVTAPPSRCCVPPNPIGTQSRFRQETRRSQHNRYAVESTATGVQALVAVTTCTFEHLGDRKPPFKENRTGVEYG